MEFTTEIVKIKRETYDVKTFRLKSPANFSFIPGQYCLVSITDEEKPFTFASSPTEKSYFELTIKKFGDFTTKLHEEAKTGDKLKINGPLGESLNFDESIKDDVVYLTGGSGITPFISHLRYAIAKNLKNKFVLIFTNKSEKDIIYRKELQEINKRKNFTIINTVTDDIPNNWQEEKGRINKEMIEKYVKNPKEKLFYICGPPGMVRGMREMLLEMNIDENKIKVEDWQLPGKHDA